MHGETKENPHPNLNLDYPHFKKESKQYWVKEEKQELLLLLMAIYILPKSDKNLSNQNQNKAIPSARAAKYEDQPEMVVCNKNVLVPEAAHSSDTVSDIVGVFDFKFTKNQDVVTYQHFVMILFFLGYGNCKTIWLPGHNGSLYLVNGW